MVSSSVFLVGFVLTSIITALVSFLPTYYVGRDGVNEVAGSLRDALGLHVTDLLTGYVDGVQRENTKFQAKFNHSLFDIAPADKQLELVKYMCAVVQTSEDIVYAQVATFSGTFVGCESITPTDGSPKWYQLSVRNVTDWGYLNIFTLDGPETFQQLQQTRHIPGYDPNLRPWFQLVSRRQAWTAPYLYSDGVTVGVTADIPLQHPITKQPYGAYATDIKFNSLSNFLRSLNYVDNGRAFVVDNNTLDLVGLSWTSEDVMVNITGGDLNDWKVLFKRAENITDPLASAVVRKLGGSSKAIMAMATGTYELSHFWVSLIDIKDAYGLHWRVVLILDEDDFLGKLERRRNNIIIAIMCVIVVMLLAQTMWAYKLITSITSLTDRMKDVNNNLLNLSEPSEIMASSPAVQPSHDFSAMSEVAQMERNFSQMKITIQSFAKFVPKEVVLDLLVKGELAEVGVTPAYCTVLFVDIESFTTISQRVDAADLARMMGLYYDRMTDLTTTHGGVVDKFIGDAIMAVWGAPLEVDNQNLRAALTAVNMRMAVKDPEMQEAFSGSGLALSVRIGVSAGSVLAGNVGGKSRLNFTLIGDAVNLASRLESLNKHFGTKILVSDTMIGDLQDFFVTRLLGHVKVCGFERAAYVYEVLGLVPDLHKSTMSPRRLQKLKPQRNAWITAASPASNHSGNATPIAANVSVVPVDASVNPLHLDLGSEYGVSTASNSSHIRSLGAGSSSVDADILHARAMRLNKILAVRDIVSQAKQHVHICTQDEAAFAALYSQAVTLYLSADFHSAVDTLNQCLTTIDTDCENCTALRQLCEVEIAKGTRLSDNWSGTIELSNK